MKIFNSRLLFQSKYWNYFNSCILGVCLLFGFFKGLSQNSDFQVITYDQKSGLPQNMINTIAEDELGYLWIGTFGGGLVRFDGKEFINYTIADGLLSNIVNDIRIDKNGVIWMAHRSGISRFDGNDFKTYRVPSADGVMRNVYGIAIMGDSVLYSGSGNIFGHIYKDSVFEVPYFNDPEMFVKSGMTFSDSILFLHQSNGKLRCIEGARTSYYDLPDSCKSPGCATAKFSTYTKDTLLIELGANQVYTFSLISRKFARFSKPYFIKFYDNERSVEWISSQNILLRKVSEELPIDTIEKDIELNDLWIDKYGATWLCTNKGLLKHVKKKFRRLADQLNDIIITITFTPDGAMWIGTQFKGIVRVQQGNYKHYVDKQNPQRNSINYLFVDSNGTLWVATKSGLGKYNPNQDKFEWIDAMRLDHIWANSIDEGPDGTLYIGTIRGGVTAHKNGVFRHYSFRNEVRIPSAACVHFSSYYKTLYTGFSGGINSFTEDTITSIQLKELRDTWITSIDSFRDSLLVIGSVGGGVIFYRPELGVKKVLNKASGLHNDIVYFVRPHPDGSVWIGSQSGFTNIRLDSELNITKIRHYSNSSGLVKEEANQFAYYFSGNKTIFGTTDGVYAFVDEETLEEQSKIHLTKVELFYQDSTLNAYAGNHLEYFDVPANLELPYNQNHLTFHFNIVNKTGSEITKFKYFLDGFDKTWSMATDKTNVTYGNLPSGEFVFKVLATDANGVWMSEPLEYAFIIKPPFYRTSAFIISSVILVIMLVFWVAHIRAKAKYQLLLKIKEAGIVESDRLRKELVKDFHDELGNYLARIINYINLLRINAPIPFTREELYNKVEDLSRKLYTGTKDLIWSIDQQLDKADSLFIYIRDFGHSLFSEETNFRAYNTVDKNHMIKEGISRDVVLICKEALTNAYKHSGASEVVLQFSESDSCLCIVIKDNGKGIPSSLSGTGSGLKNFKERAEKMQANLKIWSEENKGTSITLIIPSTTAQVSKNGSVWGIFKRISYSN